MLSTAHVNANADTRDCWNDWSSLRRTYRGIFNRISEIYKPLGGKALLLGAGNGNDVDIDYLEAAFDEIVLVDIDSEALECFLSKTRQSKKFSKVVIDLTGLYSKIPDLKNMSENKAAALMRSLQPKSGLAKIEEQFDFIMGCNYATQLLGPTFTSNYSPRIDSGIGEFLQEVNFLTDRVLKDIFTHIKRLLKNDGIFVHSTDTFELKMNKLTKQTSPATLPILQAIGNDYRRLGDIASTYHELRNRSMHISGSHVPQSESDDYKLQKLFVIPWFFEETEVVSRVYINFVYFFTHKN
ncbi:hypothetical protein DFQ01_14232 [Paenibacillus cellulosilyticus]|uniref:Methyltransferase family protein n=1 Tax=Paenibacillus cellulosilyticus TaxID=375489 RepID=A0A2V2YF44_9BACL|nr:hypothetical protein [Paenibacillus cellulosilyticus]PWV90584.1 hypothetical protein DFQ01_14232 [Paenibacillus cellulosilyticus]QKS46785.1 hypothetical protein HUB94_20010 [Paenibacillus cellulosilyticus]